MDGGYGGAAAAFLAENGVGAGDRVRITADAEYVGLVMPAYGGGGDGHLVLKLENGYNVGIGIDGIGGIRREPDAADVQEAAPAAPRAGEGLPRLLLLSTGGTIASWVDYRTGAVRPALSAGELAALVPELADIADIEAESLLSEYSENINPGHWVRMAGRIAECASYDGILVAHGTDTMHYTSAYLSFALSGFPRPVVLVGAQRSSDRPSSDAATNLVGAARFITSAGRPGVWVAMHLGTGDDAIAVHAGTRVRKNHASKRGAFETIGAPPAFVVRDEKIDENFARDYFASSEFAPRIGADQSAVLLKCHPGLPVHMFEHAADTCGAVILEGTGLGHADRSLLGAIRGAVSRGVFVGMATQCIGGRVDMDVYGSGRDLQEAGVVPLPMVPEAALAKAIWIAGTGGGMGRMLEPVASEMG
ncbi:Glutamyl-tRNA(Gln) amidotransferase subunit D [Nitrosopumilaceae archaeon]|nr:Glu-tRNA(Gln) amidotransferase subunit GatD [Nitrosopumilus sp.]CAI9832402.1 Glutamyl-tRNA(Gln) amidotransferase subunit D [Nitrosopumilaceae archaeon]MDA7945187.1 Glu-tRNA(Gln) amidotransferase subunit GatD [Nitrosopumilus sp.]MDA7955038.1 Glu-tRNA(Gln) amidotransferase subunit GatD [Nitrosopumilus sp.]MDA7974115.1 Glu-tRNA(Gln) amidotransferase subunit GatD [Nitrosopumilus sp.]